MSNRKTCKKRLIMRIMIGFFFSVPVVSADVICGYAYSDFCGVPGGGPSPCDPGSFWDCGKSFTSANCGCHYDSDEDGKVLTTGSTICLTEYECEWSWSPSSFGCVIVWSSGVPIPHPTCTETSQDCENGDPV